MKIGDRYKHNYVAAHIVSIKTIENKHITDGEVIVISYKTIACLDKFFIGSTTNCRIETFNYSFDPLLPDKAELEALIKSLEL